MSYKRTAAVERWYPLTYPGHYTDTLDITDGLDWEHCALDVTAFRGCTLGISALCGDDGRCVLTDSAGAVLGSWQDVPAELTIPETAGRLYLSNHHTRHADFYLTVPAGTLPKSNGLLFYEDFTRSSAPDKNDFADCTLHGACTEQGLILSHGVENALVSSKSTAADRWTITAELTAREGTETVFFGTRITQPHLCKHATLCSVDFTAGVLRLYRGSNGRELPSEVIQTADILPILREGDEEFTLRMERLATAIQASITNNATGQQVTLYEGLTQEETETTIAGGCRAGKMYDSAQLFVTAGRPVIRRFYAAAKTTPKVMFFGDSLTQGAHNLPENGWAQMSAAYFGNSMCCGRGSGDVWSCLNQVRSMVPVCRPKVMVVTIGTNNRPEMPASLYDKFLHMAEYWGILPIVNCVPACNKRPQAEVMNRYLRQLPCLKCRFDLVTTHGSLPGGQQIMDYYVADATHLSGAGNRALYERFIRDFGWLKEL